MRFFKLTKKKVIVLIILFIIGALVFAQLKKPKAATLGSSNLSTGSQSVDDDNLTVDANLMPAQYAELGFPETVTGFKIETVNVKEGETVTKNQLLVKISADTTDEALDAAQDKLDQANAKLKNTQSANASSMAGKKLAAKLELVTAQQKLNALIAKPTATDLALAEQAVKDALAKLDETKLAGSASEIAAAQYTYDTAQINLSAVKKGAAADEIEIAQIEVDKAQQAYDELNKGISLDANEALSAAKAEVKAADADLKKAKAEVAKNELRSPIDGKIVYVGAKAGETTKGGVVLVRVADTSSWELKTSNVTESEVYKILPDQKIKFTLDAIPNAKFDGTVKSVQNFGASDKGDVVYPVIISVSKNDERFRWGMLSSVIFPVK